MGGLDVCTIKTCRSGTEEDYTELTQLLEDIHSYQRDMQKKVDEEKAAKYQKEVLEKSMAEEMRKSAMETISRKPAIFVYMTNNF